MATTKKTTKAQADPLENSVVVLETHVGIPLVIRANPTDEAVHSFVEEHHRRYLAGEAGGPSGEPAYRIFNARRYTDETAFDTGTDPVAEIDLGDILPTP